MSELAEEIREANRYHDEHHGAWLAEQRETAARIANDMQEVVALVEQKARAWAADGLLDLTHRVAQYDTAARRYVMADLPDRSVDAAASHLATIVLENLGDALSLKAREAREVAQ